MDRGLVTERPNRTKEPRVSLVYLAVARQRIARMQIERHIEPLDRRPERPILRQVVMDNFVCIAGLREAVDQRSAETKLLDATLELPRRAIGILHRQRGQSLKSIGPLGHLFGEIIVGLA